MKKISNTVENYDSVSNDIKFLPKSMIRLAILKTLYECPMNMKEVYYETKINYSAISNTMHMLELRGYIYRENSCYFLSNAMRIYMANMLRLGELMILLERIAPISQDHIVQALPLDSIYNFHHLDDVNLVESDGLNVYKTYDLIEKTINKANYLNAILPFSYNNFNESINKLASKNKEIHLISPSDIKEFLLKNIKASKSNVKIDFLDLDENDCLLLVCSDKKMMLGFFKDDGVYDQNRLLTSTNDECIEWANELFNNFKKENM
ncbi:MAG: transcriptional regulator FilR1 domain-containing protein [Methanobrevibacter sp.]|nr:transcriptional regulator FilR1 domain-containing protein [Methanobrevibacter sp.]